MSKNRSEIRYTQPLDWQCVNDPDWDELSIPNWRVLLTESLSGVVYVVDSLVKKAPIRMAFSKRFEAEEWYMRNVCRGHIVLHAVCYASSFEQRRKLNITP